MLKITQRFENEQLTNFNNIQTRSSAEIWKFLAPCEAIQIRSVIASTAPKAQQLPQLSNQTNSKVGQQETTPFDTTYLP